MSHISQIHWQKQSLDATLSDTKPEADFDESDQDGIVSAFTTTIKSTEEAIELIDEEEELMESKFEKMDERDDIYTAYIMLYKVSKMHEKFYWLATRKLSEVELEERNSPPRLMKLIKTLEC